MKAPVAAHRMAAILAGASIVAACLAAQADVRRRITVRSNPEGALVYIDDQQIGYTPASTSFIYYGTRKIQLMKDGFKTITVKETFSPPWYEFPGIDFFSENVYPGELRDERVLDFHMEPETIPPVNELWQRAEALRAGARAGPIAVPPSGALPLEVTPFPLAPPVSGAPAETIAPPPGVALPPALPPVMRLPPPTQILPNPTPFAPAPTPSNVPLAPPDSIRPFPSL